MALISDLPNATPQKSDLMEIQNGQTSSNNSSVGQLMQLSASENLAPAYDASAGVYAVGDFVSYNGTLYQCNTAIATPEAFDATKWTAKKVVDMTGSDIPVSDTDATTIADKLDNVPTFNTLTTSDNNKLLGVSVSGSDISVGAVSEGTGIDITSNTVSLDINGLTSASTLSGTEEIAIYDGTGEKKTTAAAVAGLANNWVLAGQVMGTTTINVPAGWKEVYAIIRYGTSGGLQPQVVTALFNPSIEDGLLLTTGGGTLFGQVRKTNANTFGMIYMGVSGGDYTNTSQLTIYYK